MAIVTRLRALRSLRAKLIFAFVFVIFLCLLLASATFVFLLSGYQTEVRTEQLEQLATAMSFQAGILDRLGMPPDQIALAVQSQATRAGVRVFLLDNSGVIVYDSQNDLQGQQMKLPADSDRPNRQAYSLAYRGPDGENLMLVLSQPRPLPRVSNRILDRAPNYSLVLAVPQQSLTSAWLALAPNLSLAALVSLIASVAVGIILSRSITRPISAVTRASEEMAKGNYDQSVPLTGQDEIGRMAVAFNRMATEVKTSHRTLRDFLANVSHDLKTPLTSIQGFSQAMVEGAIKDEEGLASAARIINEEADRMRQMVDDLLYLSKIESGQIPMEKAPVDLKSLIDSCTRKTEIQSKKAGVSTVLQVEDVPMVEGDAHKLEQVLANLLDNAVKHTPAGGVITIGADVARNGTALGKGLAHRRSGVRPRPTVRIAVHNTGSAIPEDEIEKVFERFYQADKSRSRSGSGSGLGLAIVKEIVQAHGGSVEVRSDAKIGTEFVVYLPTIQV